MSSMRSVRSSTRYPKRDRTPAAQPAAPAPKATSRKRKAAASSGSAQKKARKGATTPPNSITSIYQRLVFEAVASYKKGASYTSIHEHVSSAKPEANRKLVTKAVAALVGSGLIEPTKRHQRTFKTSAKADKAVSAQNKAAKKKAKKVTKKAAPAKAKKTKKAAPKKTKKTKKAAPKKTKKKAAPKKTKKKAASKGPKLTGYQKLVLDAVASAPRGGASHTQIHASVKAAKENANKTYITKAVRSVVDMGMIVSAKRHARKFILKK